MPVNLQRLAGVFNLILDIVSSISRISVQDRSKVYKAGNTLAISTKKSEYPNNNNSANFTHLINCTFQKIPYLKDPGPVYIASYGEKGKSP